MTKTKVTPSKTQVVNRRYLWTESSSVRNWIRSTTAYYKLFVNHRTGEIQISTEPQEWRFVPGSQNVRDLITRSGLSPGYCVPEEWLVGPGFLEVAEEEWPQDIPWIAVLDIRSSNTCMTTKITRLTSSFDSGTVQLNQFNDLKTLENGIRELVKRAQGRTS